MNNEENKKYKVQREGIAGQTDINSEKNKNKMRKETKIKIAGGTLIICVTGLIIFSCCHPTCNKDTDSYETTITSVTTSSGNYIDGFYDDTSIEESTTKESSKTTTTSNTKKEVTEISDLDSEPTVTTVPYDESDGIITTQTAGTTAPTWEDYVTDQTTTKDQYTTNTDTNITTKSDPSETTRVTTTSETTVPTLKETESDTKTKPTFSETSQISAETKPTIPTGPTGSITNPTGSSDTKPSSTEPPVTVTNPIDTKTEPPVTVTNPMDTKTEPPVTVTNPIDTKTEPPVTVTNPPVSSNPIPNITDFTGQTGIGTDNVYDPFAKKVFVKNKIYRYFWHK